MIMKIKKMTKSEAKRLYWSKIDSRVRSKKARDMAIIKHRNMTVEQKREHAMKMVRARLSKKNDVPVS